MFAVLLSLATLVPHPTATAVACGTQYSMGVNITWQSYSAEPQLFLYAGGGVEQLDLRIQ